MTEAAAKGYTFPNGHLGHLTDVNRSAFEKFKQLCVERKGYTPGTDSSRPSHSDATLLRFLRARKFELQPAWQQFADTEKWRSENQLEELYETIDIHDYDETRRLYPQWTGRRDKRGMPLYVFEVGSLNPKVIQKHEQMKELKGNVTPTKSNAQPKMLKLFALYENLMRCTTPWSTSVPSRPYRESPITQGNNLIDIGGTGLKQFWDLKSHLQDSSALATAHYPETLDKIFVIGAPSFFPTVWSWIKRYLDPVVVSKIHICSSGPDALKTLMEHIDIQNIPKKYGGQLDYSFGDLPDLDPEMFDGMEWTEKAVKSKDGKGWSLPPGPVRWEESEDGKMSLIAVGSEDGAQRRMVLGTLNRNYNEVFFMEDTSGGSDKTGNGAENGVGEITAKMETAAIETAPGKPIGSTHPISAEEASEAQT